MTILLYLGKMYFEFSNMDPNFGGNMNELRNLCGLTSFLSTDKVLDIEHENIGRKIERNPINIIYFPFDNIHIN